jgi:hypothetical protein
MDALESEVETLAFIFLNIFLILIFPNQFYITPPLNAGSRSTRHVNHGNTNARSLFFIFHFLCKTEKNINEV